MIHTKRSSTIGRLRLLGILTCATFIATAVGSCSRPPRREQATAYLMGTRFLVVYYADADRHLQGDEGLARRAFDRISELDARLSDYRADSEIRRLATLAETGPTGWEPASADLIATLATARDVSERSDGAFDVTVGPLTRIWRRVFRQHEVRTGWREQLTALADQTVDWRAVESDPTHGRVRLAREGMQLDLGGIAKGYALDQALLALAAAGVRRGLVDGGGDVAVLGLPPGRDHWVVTIPDPFGDPARSPTRLKIVAGSLCTSGDLYRYTEIDGIRYSHLVDPRTGMALTDRIHVTVHAGTGILADALASALSVLGDLEGRDLAERWPGVEARISTLAEGRRITTETSGFAALVIH